MESIFNFVSILAIGTAVLCALIIVHEFGHFIVAKWCGVGVVKFSVGLGKVLCKWQRAETTYQVCAIPFGGYVRMVGDMPDSITGESVTDDAVRDPSAEIGVAEEDISPELAAMLDDKSYWFLEKTLWQKAAIVFAGPLFNFIFSVVCIFCLTFFYGKRLDHGLYGEAPESIPSVVSVVGEGSPAELAGIESGDRITSISGQTVSSWIEVAKVIKESQGAELQLVVENDSGEKNLNITPQLKELPYAEGKKSFVIGISPQTIKEVGVLGALESGVTWTYNASMATCLGLIKMLNPFEEEVSTDEIGGPIMIFNAAAQHAKRGPDYLLLFMGILNVSLAVLNLLPIPILDGGHLVFFALEGLFGQISLRSKEIAQSFGLLIILGLMGLGVFNDLTRKTEPVPEPKRLNWQENEKVDSSAFSE